MWWDGWGCIGNHLWNLTALKCHELPHLLTLGYCGGMGGVYLEPSLELTAVECYKLPHLLTLDYCGGMGGGVFGTIFGINSCKLILFWDGWDWLMFCLSVCPSVSNKIKTVCYKELGIPYP